MNIYLFNKIVGHNKAESADSQLSSNSYDAYVEEHKRLEGIKNETENIWEERTYKLSAGGLSLTFAMFSFLMGHKNGITLRWPMAVIWFFYALCLILNYISHHIAKNQIVKFQKLLHDYRNNGVEYDEEKLIELYSVTNCKQNVLNGTTEILLILNILFTLIYTCILFAN